MNLLATIVIADVVGGLVLHKLLKRRKKKENEVKEIHTENEQKVITSEKPH